MAHLELDHIVQELQGQQGAGRRLARADAGEIVVIFGPSGTGKTVLLRLIAGVEEPDAGDDPHRRRRTWRMSRPSIAVSAWRSRTSRCSRI